MKRLLLSAMLTAALSTSVFANDTSAELAAGGLLLTRNDDITMKSEDLFISASEVQVRYVFVNTAARDVTVHVAFPMPDIDGLVYSQQDIGIPEPGDAANFLGFRTLVDGTPVAMEVEQKALVIGVDRTEWLTSRGVPVALHLSDVDARLGALPRVEQEEAIALGLAVVEEYDAGRGWERHLNPAWTLRTTFHWKQTFPAGREVKIEHRYKPVVGGTVGTMIGTSGFTSSPGWPTVRDRYCIDNAFLGRVARIMGLDDYPKFSEEWITYVLTTGGNWAGPIGDFRLVVDKGSPDNLVSFCATGVTKTGPTTFEVRKTDWTPDRDLSILILKPLYSP